MSNSEVSQNIEKIFCRDCGENINKKAVICPKCGVPQKAVGSNDRSRLVAALFAFFLGGIGVHKFYTGKIGLGFLYLIFFWTFIPLVISFIEFLIFLTMSDDTFNEKYNA